MKKEIFLIILLIFFLSCTQSNFEKEITLSSGKKISVSFKKMVIDNNEPILSIVYKTDERKVREDSVEKEVLEIWSGVKEEAEKLDLKEALIKYSFFAGEKTKEDKIIHHILIFEASKIENGSWKIRKVN